MDIYQNSNLIGHQGYSIRNDNFDKSLWERLTNFCTSSIFRLSQAAITASLSSSTYRSICHRHKPFELKCPINIQLDCSQVGMLATREQRRHGPLRTFALKQTHVGGVASSCMSIQSDWLYRKGK